MNKKELEKKVDELKNLAIGFALLPGSIASEFPKLTAFQVGLFCRAVKDTIDYPLFGFIAETDLEEDNMSIICQETSLVRKMESYISEESVEENRYMVNIVRLNQLFDDELWFPQSTM